MACYIKPFHIPFLLVITLLVLAESAVDAHVSHREKHKLHRVPTMEKPMHHGSPSPLHRLAGPHATNSKDPALFAAEVMRLAKRLVVTGPSSSSYNGTTGPPMIEPGSEEEERLLSVATPELLIALEQRLLDLQLAVRHARELLDAGKALPAPPPNHVP